jgi:dihydrolipoamide dehydrogenase
MELRIVVIGSGPGGYAAVLEAARRGARVSLIERDAVGGTCLNWGCIPTKTWKSAAELAERLVRAEEFGVIIPGAPAIDLSRLLARKNMVVETLRKGMLNRLREAGVQFLTGEASVPDPRTVRVRRPDGGTDEVSGDRLILAPGSSPAGCSAFPFDSARILSTNDALNLLKIPASVLIIGGGVNGCEFASILAAFGSRVTIVEALPRLLPMEAIDADTSHVVAREMKKRGIAVLLGRVVESAVSVEDRVRAVIAPAGSTLGEPVETVFDLVLVTVGRRPCCAGMGLEHAGVRVDGAGWIEANDRMETSVPGVYAVGDALGPSRVMLAHAASAEGTVAAVNALGGIMVMDYRAVPFAVFTSPEAAGVGLTEAQARAADPDTRAQTFFFRALGRAQAAGELAGHVKIVSDAAGKILGVHIVGAHASELIAEGTFALRMGATVEDLVTTIHAHPTFSEAVQEAARTFTVP